MLSKNQISQLKSLHQKKFRNEENSFIAEGIKVVNELLNSDFKVKQVYGTEEYFEKLPAILKNKIRAEFQLITEMELERISAMTSPNEVLAVAEIKTSETLPDALDKQLSFYLDGMRDPGNLGTILRIADWFGIQNVICSDDSVDCYNPKVVQASMGSLFRVNVTYTAPENFLSHIHSFSDLPVYGTLMEGENLFEKQLSGNGIIILGNESMGIRPGLLSVINRRITIPRFSTADRVQPDSLNVSVAAAIVAAEFRRHQ